MSREKQIEEMAKVIHDSDIADINTFPISMSECLARHGARRTGAAMALFKADYRKQVWISVDDRLPTKEDSDKYEHVLAITRDGRVRDWGYELVIFSSKKFTHWMPLPEPPEMKGSE